MGGRGGKVRLREIRCDADYEREITLFLISLSPSPRSDFYYVFFGMLNRKLSHLVILYTYGIDTVWGKLSRENQIANIITSVYRRKCQKKFRG